MTAFLVVLVFIVGMTLFTLVMDQAMENIRNDMDEYNSASVKPVPPKESVEVLEVF